MTTLSDLAFHVLLALGDGPSHGYAIGKDVDERSGGRLDPTTGALYQVLRRLAEEKLAVLCVLHQVELAYAYAHRVVGIRDGRLEFDLPRADVSRDAVKRLGMNLEEIDRSKVTFFRGRGCEVCKGSGYKGRVGCYELMPVTDKVRELILAHASAYAIREAAIEAGMKTLKEDAMEKILLGMTTLEESLRVIYAG